MRINENDDEEDEQPERQRGDQAIAVVPCLALAFVRQSTRDRAAHRVNLMQPAAGSDANTRSAASSLSVVAGVPAMMRDVELGRDVRGRGRPMAMGE